MVKHHSDYERGETEEISKSEHWYIHHDACQLCKAEGFNLLRARFNLDPITYIRNGKVYSCGHWVALCYKCWHTVLEIPDLKVDLLHKNTWWHSMKLRGNAEETREFVREYIRRYGHNKVRYPKYITEVLR